MGALYSLREPGTGAEVEQRWYPKELEPGTFVDVDRGKRYMVLLDGNAPQPPDPDAELDAALAALPAGASVPNLVSALRAWLARRTA